ncbi:MAG: hypothetical protein ACRDRZ_10245 [Pseudonocardiaceae bacterium]
MSAVAVRRGRFGEVELRPVREHTVKALHPDDAVHEDIETTPGDCAEDDD